MLVTVAFTLAQKVERLEGRHVTHKAGAFGTTTSILAMVKNAKRVCAVGAKRVCAVVSLLPHEQHGSAPVKLAFQMMPVFPLIRVETPLLVPPMFALFPLIRMETLLLATLVEISHQPGRRKNLLVSLVTRVMNSAPARHYHTVIGIPSTPDEFINKALEAAVSYNSETFAETVDVTGVERTAALRKWVARAQALRDDESSRKAS